MNGISGHEASQAFGGMTYEESESRSEKSMADFLALSEANPLLTIADLDFLSKHPQLD